MNLQLAKGIKIYFKCSVFNSPWCNWHSPSQNWPNASSSKASVYVNEGEPLCISSSVSVKALAGGNQTFPLRSKALFPPDDLYYVSRPWVGSWLSRLCVCLCVCEWVRESGFWLNTSINGKGIRERLSPLSSPHRPVGETRLQLDLGMRRDGGRAAYLILSKKSPPTSLSHTHTQTHTKKHRRTQTHSSNTHAFSHTHSHMHTLISPCGVCEAAHLAAL